MSRAVFRRRTRSCFARGAVRRAVTGFAVFLAAATVFRPAAAETIEDATTRPVTEPLERLADRQGIIKARLARLEDRLFQLSQALARSEPDRSARLLDALSQSRHLLLRQRIDDIIRELRQRNVAEAMDGQERVAADLEQLLKTLLDEAADPKDLEKEIDALSALREQLRRITREQEAERDAALRAARAEQRREALARAKQQIEDLLRKQEDLTRESEKTRDPAARPDDRAAPQAGPPAGRQRDVREKTEDLARELDHPAEGIAPGESKPDRKKGDADTQTPPSDTGRGGSESPPGDHGRAPQGSMGKEEATPPSDAARELNDAAGEMKKAEQRLEDGSEPAVPHQQNAEQHLRRAIERLAEEDQALEKDLDLLRQAQEQRDTAARTEELARRMDGSKGTDGKPGEGQGPSQDGAPEQPGDEQKPSESDAPAGRQTREAVPHQKQAAEDLGNRRPKQAAEKQEQALEKLRAAQRELEDVLEQLRREQQEEVLAALEARFQAMLAKQLDVNKRTNRLDALGQSRWSRTDQLELAAVAGDQQWVGDEADKALAVLRDDGTTIVVPQIVEEIRDDARDAARRLASTETGPAVRQMQEAIVEALQQLIDSVQQMRRQDSNDGGPQDSTAEQDRPPPLLPGSAELKLLRSCQARINRLTRELEQQRVLPESPVDDLRERLRALERRQDTAARLARDMLEGQRGAQ